MGDKTQKQGAFDPVEAARHVSRQKSGLPCGLCQDEVREAIRAWFREFPRATVSSTRDAINGHFDLGYSWAWFQRHMAEHDRDELEAIRYGTPEV